MELLVGRPTSEGVVSVLESPACRAASIPVVQGAVDSPACRASACGLRRGEMNMQGIPRR
jgi:hypothetical protein